MRRFIWLAAMLAAFGLLMLSACESSSETPDDTDGDNVPGDGDSDSDEPDPQNAVTIHLKSDWVPYLWFSTDGGESFIDYPGVVMTGEGNGWYVSENVDRGNTGQLHFLFNNGANDQDAALWIRPWGREDCLDCAFATSADEIWIFEGRLYTERPDESDGDVPDGDTTDGDAPDGDVTDGDAPDGDVTDGDVTDGDVTDGDVTDGDASDGDVTDGDVTDGDVTDGDVIDGDATDGDVDGDEEIDGDDTDGDVTDGDETDGDVVDGDEPTTSYTVHLFSGWAQPYLHHSLDGNTGDPSVWTTLPGVAMASEGSGWWAKTVEISQGYNLVFLFNDGADDWSRPFGCTDIGCNFETSSTEVWVRDGVIYTAQPSYASYTVHFDTDWATPYLYYSIDGGTQWVGQPGVPMVADSRAAWFSVTVDINASYNLVFVLNDGGSNWQNCVSGGCDCGNDGCNFLLSASEAWISGGVMSTTPPFEDGDVVDGDETDGDIADGDDDDDLIDGDLVDGDDEITTTSYTVHLYSSWVEAYLHHSFDGNTGDPSIWTELPGVAMSDEGDGWWVATVEIPQGYNLAFVFNNDDTDWHKPFGCEGDECYFDTAETEVWVRDGFLYTDEPVYADYAIHFETDWATPYLYYSVDGGTQWVGLPGVAMQALGKAVWFSVSVSIEDTYDLVFLFNDGAGNWQGCESGGCSCKGKLQCNFTLSAPEAWVIGGVISTDGPPVDGDIDDELEAEDTGCTEQTQAADCGAGYYCAIEVGQTVGACAQDCTGDGECDLGEVCNISVGQCIPDCDCIDDNACPLGTYCENACHCVMDCNDEVTCSEGFECDARGRCVEITDRDYTVHMKSGWSAAYLYYSDNGGSAWPGDSGSAMTQEYPMWWQVDVTVPLVYDLLFVFTNGDGDWHNQSGGGNFSTSTAEVWVKDGTLYDSQPDTLYTVHHQSGWSQPYLFYLRDDGNWNQWPMASEGDGWFVTHTVIDPANDLEFVFTDGVDDWHNPTGGGNFVTDDTEVWVKDGVLYNDQPVK